MARQTKQESKTLEDCFERLKELGFDEVRHFAPKAGERHDGFIHLSGPCGKVIYVVAVKRALTETSVIMLANQLRSRHPKDSPVLFCTEYVYQNLAETLRDNKIEFVDTAGNIYLSQPGIYVFVTGKKPARRPERPTRAFQGTGLKLIFILLKNPEAVHWDYRRLAKAAGIALGNIGWILRDLRELGFLRLVGRRKRELVNRPELFRRWELAYSERLRPKILQNRCRLASGKTLADLADFIEKSDVSDSILLGGELGASFLVGGLRPETAALHLCGETRKLTTQLHLVPAEGGPIDVLETFGEANYFEDDQVRGFRLADPLLIHAELLQRPSERLLEIAQEIYDCHVTKGDEKK